MHCFKISAFFSVLFLQAIAATAVPALGGLPVDTSNLSAVKNVSDPSAALSSLPVSSMTGGSNPLDKLNSLPLSMPHVPAGTESLGGLAAPLSRVGSLRARKIARAFGSPAVVSSNRKIVRALAQKKAIEAPKFKKVHAHGPKHSTRKVRRVPRYDQ